MFANSGNQYIPQIFFFFAKCKKKSMTFFDSGVSEVERHDTQQNNTLHNNIQNNQKNTQDYKTQQNGVQQNEDSQHNIKSATLSITSHSIHLLVIFYMLIVAVKSIVLAWRYTKSREIAMQG